MNGNLNRDELHRLVDQLSDEQLLYARRALERVRAHTETEAEDDIKIINAHANELNAEAEDVLGYPAEW